MLDQDPIQDLNRDHDLDKTLCKDQDQEEWLKSEKDKGIPQEHIDQSEGLDQHWDLYQEFDQVRDRLLQFVLSITFIVLFLKF